MAITNVEFPQRYGGNIRVYLSGRDKAASGDEMEALYAREKSFGQSLAQLPELIDRWRASKLAALTAEFERHGPLKAKAFPGRAAILIKVLGVDDGLISAVYEKPASQKIGHYVPGTRIPIRSDDEFPANAGGGGPLLNLAWHIPREIESYMRERGFDGRIIDIVSQEDFLER